MSLNISTEVIWQVMLITGLALFVLSWVLFFAWHILDLADDLSGRKAERRIKKIRESSPATGYIDETGALDSKISSISHDESLNGVQQNQMQFQQPMENGLRRPKVASIQDENVSMTNMNNSNRVNGNTSSGIKIIEENSNL